jgi:hypothetical protein
MHKHNNEELEGFDWINLTGDKGQLWSLVNTVIKPSGSIKGREFLDYLCGRYLVKNGSDSCS